MLALVAAVIALTGGALGIDTLWPVLLAAAVGLAAASSLSLGRGAAFVGGALIGWVAMAIRAGLLPDTVAAQAIVVVIGIALVTAIAAATADLAPMWAGLVGYAAFAGFYEPIFAESPTTFVADSTVAIITVLLAGALGFAGALLGDLAASLGSSTSSQVVDGEVAR